MAFRWMLDRVTRHGLWILDRQDRAVGEPAGVLGLPGLLRRDRRRRRRLVRLRDDRLHRRLRWRRGVAIVSPITGVLARHLLQEIVAQLAGLSRFRGRRALGVE